MVSKNTPTDPLPENVAPRRSRLPLYALLAGLVAATLSIAALAVHWWATQPSAGLGELAEGNELYRKLPKQVTHSCGLELVLIPPGKFLMGHPPEEQGRRLPPPGRKPVPIIDPQVSVTIAEPFYIGVYEVTQEQYQRVVGANPSLMKGPSQPVERVTWEEALRFCRKLGEQDSQTYRLPTVAEWEYVCRAGTTTPFHFGATLSSAQANFDSDMPSKWSTGGPNRGKPLPVGTLPANAWGLHDMHGNVAEWCLDLFPSGGGFYHHICGGGWDSAAEWCRSAARLGWSSTSSPAVGFRVLRTAMPDPKLRLAPEPSEGGPADEAAWVRARIDEALAKPAAPLLPGVVIFPITAARTPEQMKRMPGLTESVFGQGTLVSLAASIAVAYAPRRRMALSPRLVMETFEAEGLNSHKVNAPKQGRLSDVSVRRCLDRLGCKLYVQSRYFSDDKGERLVVELHGDADHPDRNVTHMLPKNDMNTIPGLLALDVLDWLGVKPEEEEKARIRQTLFRPNTPPYRFDLLMKSAEVESRTDKQFHTFLSVHPSFTVWDVYLTGCEHPADALARYKKARGGLHCDLLDLEASALLRESGRLREALDWLLDLAPTHRGDTHYGRELTQLGAALGETTLVDHLLEKWEVYDPSALGSLERGRFLLRWAWQARGSGFAGTVTEEGADVFKKRLERARRQLETAAQKGGKIPDPHASLITVAMGLGLPREYVDKHYQAAIAADPLQAPAYHAYFNYLMPRWHGRPEDMLAFARDCVKSGLWEEDVPQLFLKAVNDMAFDDATGIYRREVFQNPVVWDGLKLYFGQTRKMVLSAPRGEPWVYFNDRVCSYYLLWGGYCGKRAELEEALKEITHPDLKVIPDNVTYDYIRDQIRSESGKGVERLVAKTRVALAAGDFDEAERILRPDADWPPDATAARERLRRGAAQGRRLAREGAIKLSALDILDGWTVREEKRWRVEGENLVCTLPRGKVAFVQCPFPLGSATVKGVLQCRGGLHSAQIILHAQSAMDPLRVFFSSGPRADTVGLARHNSRLGVRPTTLGPQRFHIDIGPKHDRIVVNDRQPGMLTERPSFRPGGIGFEAYTAPLEGGELVLGPLEITMRTP